LKKYYQQYAAKCVSLTCRSQREIENIKSLQLKRCNLYFTFYYIFLSVSQTKTDAYSAVFFMWFR